MKKAIPQFLPEPILDNRGLTIAYEQCKAATVICNTIIERYFDAIAEENQRGLLYYKGVLLILQHKLDSGINLVVAQGDTIRKLFETLTKFEQALSDPSPKTEG